MCMFSPTLWGSLEIEGFSSQWSTQVHCHRSPRCSTDLAAPEESTQPVASGLVWLEQKQGDLVMLRGSVVLSSEGAG